mmetsp:Transcript_13209/g.33269  ORF Transcript_13209/g.33269 Transcript_13209/m.33269 type:complete len:208 (-) Transcript_13209:157-780(-)|eukprot:CAMPEP_0116102358 /NCGR_PEP_ID=MMETSP0327-20121206/13303_1 /TAXON_ID=44447 /ORGANISM="Pseudo-nitzschia delicatissima, Strain B596" /LENGTH=207 /DNA_ID=CAMNT_0003594385 /DNA_START=176 /DNA_END=799 /DNA_ORIENTATION=+
MPPPLPPKPLGTYLTGYPSTPPTIEVQCYLDMVCPFSCKMYRTLYEDVLPAIKADKTKEAAIAIKIHHVVQPWHPQSTLVQEAAMAIKKVDTDEAYLAYLLWITKKRNGDGKFTDEDAWSKTRDEIYSDLTSSQTKVVEAQEILSPKEVKGNGGNGVTQDIKWACKHHRAMGVHVTPTVFVNGIEAVQVSSGWKSEDWMAFFETFDL